MSLGGNAWFRPRDDPRLALEKLTESGGLQSIAPRSCGQQNGRRNRTSPAPLGKSIEEAANQSRASTPATCICALLRCATNTRRRASVRRSIVLPKRALRGQISPVDRGRGECPGVLRPALWEQVT